MSAIICENKNKSIPTYYYYIVDKNTTLSVSLKPGEQKYLVKDKETSDETLSELHEIIEDSCNKYKIVLYVLLQDTADKENDFIERFNKYIENITGIYYLNITIFSYINRETYDWILRTKKTRDLNTLAKFFIGNPILNHKKIFKAYNIYTFDAEQHLIDIFEKTAIIQYTGYDRKRLENNMQQFNLLRVPVSDIDNYGIDYLAYTFVPKIHCHIGILKQITGTCWLNALMNALLLPEMSKEIMLQNLKLYQSDKDRLPVTQLLANRKDISIQNMLSSVIYNIHVKKIKLPNRNNVDFMNVLASRMKHLINGIHEKEEEKKSDKEWLKYGEELSLKKTQEVFKYIFEHYIPFYSKNYEIVEYKTGDRIDKIRGDKSLISCIITVPGHIVCGFMCGTKEYIYDSNVTSHFFEDNWTSLHLNNFSNERLQLYVDSLTKKIEEPIFKAEFLKNQFLKDDKETKIMNLIEWRRTLHHKNISKELLEPHILQTVLLENERDTTPSNKLENLKEWHTSLGSNNFSNETLKKYIEQTTLLENQIFNKFSEASEGDEQKLIDWYTYKTSTAIVPKIKFLIYCGDLSKKRKRNEFAERNQPNASKKRRETSKKGKTLGERII